MSSAYIPMRIRDIVQDTLSRTAWGQPILTTTLSRENSKLLKELDKAQSLLKQSRKECHDLGLKFVNASEKVKEFVCHYCYFYCSYNNIALAANKFLIKLA